MKYPIEKIIPRTGIFVSSGHGFGTTLEGALSIGAGCVQIHAPSNIKEIDGRNGLRLVKLIEKTGVDVDALVGGDEHDDWGSIAAMQRTVGLTVADKELRNKRVKYYKQLAKIANDMRVFNVNGHLGAPHLLDATSYQSFIDQLRPIIDACSNRAINFNVESGPESASCLLKIIQSVDNLFFGINFDPANFVLYGTEDPQKAFQKLKGHVHGFHVKAARYTTDTRGKDWGTEVEPGEGEESAFELAIKAMQASSEISLIVEREIPGETPEQKLAGMERTLKELRARLLKA
jgi:sugar phosphate isomerase/epimerase